MKKKLLELFVFSLGMINYSKAQSFISQTNSTSDFPLVTTAHAAPIYTDSHDDWLVHKAASLLQNDIKMITGSKPETTTLLPSSEYVIIIGTINGSAIIKQLIREKKLNVDSIWDKWEAFKIQTVAHPLEGVKEALVIIGSDKRAAAYGAFELSRQMGVSPWYWWADVPVKKKTSMYIKRGSYTFKSPSVKYRGIFINDEAPAFSRWTKEKFGGVNHLVYEKMFELLLRLKANYLWPAMWGNAFNDDDTLNPILANQWGIVMGTSHHEPMLRAQQEWKRYGKGQWDYDSNKVVLDSFWKKGIESMDHHESIVTIGMRGDGDKPMTEGTATGLLEKIVADQRNIIEEVTGRPASKTPQDWALYKEVQDYYDKGMRVPDDVTLLLCDDNWGNLRKLPKLTDKARSGGYGIYYHFDYVGGPRNYKWINTNNIARVWEQMHLAYEYDVRQIWIVNVGDLKPMEFPISFFLDYAWNTEKWNENNLGEYYTQWASQQFGPEHAKEIGDIIKAYSKINARRKPELLDANTYSFNYKELNSVTEHWSKLLTEALKLKALLPAEYRDAYFQLVLHPVAASANLQNMYTAVAWNHFYAKAGDTLANKFADEATQFYTNDSSISAEYNQLNNGKWNHMMDQTHIGYTYWQEPRVQKMPEVKYVSAATATSSFAKHDSVEMSAKSLIPRNTTGNVFYELNGYVSIEAADFSAKKDAANIHWRVIPNIGRDGDGISTFPVTAAIQTVSPASPRLQYYFYCYDTGVIKLNTYFSPTLNFHNDSTGLQCAISIDWEKPQIISINKDDRDGRKWNQWVADDIIIKTTNHAINTKGKHTVKFWMISPAVILQKIVLDFGGLKQSYLGPQQTILK